MRNKFIAFLGLSILFGSWLVLTDVAASQAVESTSKTVTLRIEGMT